MSNELLAAIETGGTKILASVRAPDGQEVAKGRWETGSADQAISDLLPFLSDLPTECRLAAIGIAAFGPLIVNPDSPDFGRMLATPKAGWAGSSLRAELERQLGVPIAVDTDVNAAAIAEQQIGAGRGLASVAYVTVGTGIGAGLAVEGRSLQGALHSEAGICRSSACEEIASPALARFISIALKGWRLGQLSAAGWATGAILPMIRSR